MQMEQGMGSDVTNFFKKILSTISYGLIWLIAAVTAGIYFKLGWRGNGPLLPVILFYTIAAISFFLLLRYFYKLWKK